MAVNIGWDYVVIVDNNGKEANVTKDDAVVLAKHYELTKKHDWTAILTAAWPIAMAALAAIAVWAVK